MERNIYTNKFQKTEVIQDECRANERSNPNSKVNLIRLESSKGAPTNLGGSLALAYNDAMYGVRRKLSVSAFLGWP